MTLAEIRAANPALFYQDQHWFENHSFMDIEQSEGFSGAFVLSPDDYPGRPLVRAVDIAALYVATPADTRWRSFIWTDDVDSFGNRVYVAGVGQFGIESFQIHRHIQPACWWVMRT